ncbi:hypothetical protein HaLaN_12886 [Haematococcus lacustris]|uniref:Uncharacterized protein n=1 Tax=Haematococcus lacustris TaxID=44745 RepID=A0A699ZL00_HAELA|nr:hypothetical protein HaLaN_12886 [Haematococcus lacustris]
MLGLMCTCAGAGGGVENSGRDPADMCYSASASADDLFGSGGMVCGLSLHPNSVRLVSRQPMSSFLKLGTFPAAITVQPGRWPAAAVAAQPSAAPAVAELPAVAPPVLLPDAPYDEAHPAGGPAAVAVHVASVQCQQLAAPSAAAVYRRRGHAIIHWLPRNAIDLPGRRLMIKGDTLELGAREQAGKQHLPCPVWLRHSRRIVSRLPIEVAKSVFVAPEHVACWGPATRQTAGAGCTLVRP